MSASPFPETPWSRSQGTFVWYELTTTDAHAATRFYEAVLGWGTRDAGLPDMRYVLLTAGDTMVGGLMELPQGRDCDIATEPGWIGYIAVDDIDMMIARVDGGGGTVHRPVIDIPDIGRFAIVGDPQGAVFALLQGPSPPLPGQAGWHELHALDPEGVFPFYAGLFGWTRSDTPVGGLPGAGQFFTMGGIAAGSIVRRADPSVPPFWLHHFNVRDIDVAVETVRNTGGRVLHGPRQVPDGRWIVQGRDPQDVPFAVVGRRG
ncbi:glyoxalase [Gluconacetobacter johannae DSM 13595]|uniref:VOC family protein n=1 Tax=Gluconacetobacter johannae TaxID=112140 RepID=A0A7W4J778_9PROT|nr:VOC family protein [Gluconacetobacter johannae]MBB2175808.1 VOC family protein [Gluconacetobacter johannae]GBQ82779.1 glyoxalase [Gluconacetobacter johannae DSM 13595]